MAPRHHSCGRSVKPRSRTVTRRKQGCVSKKRLRPGAGVVVADSSALVRGCCRFIGFTTTASPLRGQLRPPPCRDNHKSSRPLDLARNLWEGRPRRDFRAQGLQQAAILSRSARLAAPILCMTWVRWTSTVRGLMPSSLAISLLVRPDAMSAMHSRSRELKRA
jgi:hypothetical protein